MDSIQRVCSIEECNKPYDGHGYCGMHLMRLKRHGDVNYQSNEFHGMKHSPEYKAWILMKDRCYNPNNKQFDDYGGRGIKVSDEWLHSFKAFYAYIGTRPSDKHSIDRIQVNGNYEPGNVRWATRRVQNLNRRMFKKPPQSGYTGVTREIQKNGSIRWVATIAQKKLGRFSTPEQASEVYEKAKTKLIALEMGNQNQ